MADRKLDTKDALVFSGFELNNEQAKERGIEGASMQESWRALYPFQDRSIQIKDPANSTCHRYHYVDEGEGRPLLMVHGNPTWSFYWHRLIQDLRGEYRCLAVDHIGCGLSDKPQHYGYRLEDHIRNLVELIDTLDLQDLTLLVHDWGGAIGLGAALERPERFSRLVLFNTGAFPPPYVPLRIAACRWPLFGTLAIRGLNAFARAAITMAVEDRHSLSPPVKEGLVAPYDNWKNRIATHRFVQDIPRRADHPTWKRLEAIEAGLTQFKDLPKCLIWGMKDWCFRPECLERFEAVWPNAETHRFGEVGHYVVLEAQERVNTTVREFLRRTDA
ncbi:MAG: alpha/beta fold hydrolase [Planctomycetota bacterium]|nr:alpha/beta fold hydrolase [Planctomycetota bacterium]